MDQTEKVENIESSKYVVVGNVDSGKSTFIGVMEKNVLDDGNGYARSLVTRLKHEKISGRTSSHSYHYMVKNNEITTMIDLCGHEKFLKTTIFGITGLFCDYGIVMVGANMGISDMTKEHISLLVANRIPFIILLNKIDICPPNILISIKKELEKIFNKNKKSVIFYEDNEVEVNGSYLKDKHNIIIEKFHSRNIDMVPIICVSNKTGHNIEFVRELMTTLKSRHYFKRINPSTETITPPCPPIMYIDSFYTITGIGIVLSGTAKFGNFSLGQKIFLGPVNNSYIPMTIKSIHNCIRENVTTLMENESGCIGVRLDSKNSYSRRMYMKGQIVTTDADFAMSYTTRRFNCDIMIFNHATTIRSGYNTIVHCNTIIQAGQFYMPVDQVLRSHSRENLDIILLSRSEFILPGSVFMFRDGKTKGMGVVKTIIPYSKKI